MKKYQIILAIAAGAMLVSCKGLNKLPVFNPDDSYVSFEKAALSATEDAGRVSIPVSLACLDPIATTVTYAVDVENSTAVEGTNFNLVDPSAVVAFNGKDRTAYIELDIINQEGVFTGDKKIVLNLKQANGINLGAESTCTFTINDLDHPLAAILGKYTLADGSVSKTITIEKDATDVTVVHFPDIMSGTKSFIGSQYDFDIVGQVSDDMSTIIIPLPVPTGYTYSNGQPLQIYRGDADAVYYEGASITLTATNTGFSSGEFGLVAFIRNAGYVEWIDPFTLTKK